VRLAAPGRPEVLRQVRAGLRALQPRAPRPAAPLEELWTALAGSWSDAEKHLAFLEECNKAGVLTEAARRYRVKTEQDPSDATAALYRDEAARRLLALAAAALPPERAEPQFGFVKVAVAVVVVVACVAFFVFILYRLTHPA